MGAIVWDPGDVPRSTRFDDTYYAAADGRAETVHVYLDGNDLPARWRAWERGLRAPFHIAEIGFGTGLSMLLAVEAWIAAGRPCPLRLTSIEGWPMGADGRARALAPWPRIAAMHARCLAGLSDAPGWHRIEIDGAVLHLGIGLAEEMVPQIDRPADAWFLDGFSPSRNPEAWTPALMAAVGAKTAPGGTAASFTAAGHVRRALSAAGFAVERVAGYGAKRHMTRARMPG
ncbi:MAG: tRNA (5-methylaminomethyl-2-thiouridine)(34)-methyltransferase MnmD [Pseudomonadota bacterium]